MTAALAKKTLAETSRMADAGELRYIFLEDLRVAEWNARKSFDPVALAELKQSIRDHGLQVPLLVRAYPESAWKTLDEHERQAAGGLYEIVAGHRRFRAAQELAFMDVPCIVRALSDAEAREVGLVDNLQREDVPALEEADAYAELRQRLGTPAAIAARVGKDVSYVAKRLQLVALAEYPRKALAERLITIDHALLLARLGTEEQDANLKWALNTNAGVKEKVADTIAYRVKDRDKDGRYGYWEPQSVLDLKNHIERNVGRKLKRAPWDLNDATLTAAGACVGCPSNTADNTALFGDLAIDDATCENGRCFEEKRATFVQIVTEATEWAGSAGHAIRLSWKDSSAAPRFEKGDASKVNLTQVFRHGQWVEAKKNSCANAGSGVTVDWSDDNRYGFGPSSSKLRKPGETLLVCVAPKCKVHPKAWEKATRSNTSGGGSYDPKAEEEKREKLRQAAVVESKIRLAAAGAALEKITKLPEAALRAILLEGVNRHDRSYEALLPGLKKALATAPILSLAFAKAVAVISIDSLGAHSHCEAKQWRPEFLASLKRLGHDGSGAWVEAKKAAAKPAKKKAPVLTAAAAQRKKIFDAQNARFAKQLAKANKKKTSGGGRA